MKLRLIPIYDKPDFVEILYKLLKERKASVNISHSKLPSFNKHWKFVICNPYRDWRFIETKDGIVGSIYLSKLNEIGIFIFMRFQGKGYGKKAVKELLKLYKGEKFLANVSPRNYRSEQFFKKLGFKHIQNTYSYK